MFPLTLTNLMFLAMGIISLILVYRLARRWLSARRKIVRENSEADQSQWSLAKANSAAPEAPITTPSTVQLDAKPVTQDIAEVTEGLSILKTASVPSGKANTGGPARWENEKLFVDSSSTYRDRNRGLPRVLAEDLPDSLNRGEMTFGALTPALASLLPEAGSRQDSIRSDLYAAGYYSPRAVMNFSAVRYLAMMLPMIFCGVLLLFVPPRFEPIVIGAIVLMPILGWSLPRLMVRNQARDRRNEIEKAMPDLLDMLNMCVSQGMTVPASLERIRVEMKGAYPALEQELKIINEQSRIGSMDVALKNFSQRVDVPEVHSFTSLLMQTSRMGTSVSGALAEYAETMRESLKQRAEEKGNRATFRLLFPTVLCLMPAVYLFLMGPAIIELSRFFYEGGRDGLDTGSSVIQRLNTNARNRVDGQQGQQAF